MKFGAVFLIGGEGEQGVFCDAWSLDVEKTVSIVEDPQKHNTNGIWRELNLKNLDKKNLC